VGEKALEFEARYHPERRAVDVADTWREGHAPYPGRSRFTPERATHAEACGARSQHRSK
jgi:hypothetical protein